MNATVDEIEPSYTDTSNSTGKPHGHDNYILITGFLFTVFVLFVIAYVSYILKHSRSRAEAYDDADNHHLVTFSHGLDDDVLITFPTFLYSDAMVSHKGETDHTDDNGSGCSICLTEYKPTTIVRLLPKCSHLFHVKCIDTWLKAHPTCPVCRNSSLTGFVAPRPVNLM